MALPPTGSTITMSQIRNYFGSATTPITMSFLGTFLGISVGTVIPMSQTFGGLGS
jgi:ABC-type phosphate/phosphonate transport system permease subunit